MWNDETVGHRSLRNCGLDDSDGILERAIAGVSASNLANRAQERDRLQDQRLRRAQDVFADWNADSGEKILAKRTDIRQNGVNRRQRLLRHVGLLGKVNGNDLLAAFNDTVASMRRDMRMAKAAQLAKATPAIAGITVISTGL